MNILNYGKLVSCREYIINSSGAILSAKYHNKYNSIDSQLLLKDNIAHYSTRVNVKGEEQDCNFVGIPDYVKTLRFCDIARNQQSDKIKDSAIVYTSSNCNKAKDDNEFIVTLKSPDGKKDYEITVFNANYIVYNVTYAQEIDIDGDIVRYYELFNDGFTLIEFDENTNIKSLSRYVITSNNDIAVTEITNFGTPSVCLSKNGFDLAERAENVNIEGKKHITLEYDEFGIVCKDSNGFVRYERSYDNDDTDITSDVVSIHPLYYDLFNLENIFDNKLFCQDQVVFYETGCLFTRTIIECTDVKKYAELCNINKTNTEEPIIEFLDYDELYDN